MTTVEKTIEFGPPVFRRYRQEILLACLIGIVVLRPFLKDVIFGWYVVQALQYTGLLAVAFAGISSRRGLWIMASLLVVSTVTGVMLRNTEDSAWVDLHLISSMGLYGAVALTLFRGLFQTGQRIDKETILKAVSVYLLMGIVWAYAYAILEFHAGGSFQFSVEPHDDSQRYQRFLGFSFVTLTTLGFGNVAPRTPKGDSLAVAEAMVGQLYIAIVMARLVAMQLMQPSTSEAKDA